MYPRTHMTYNLWDIRHSCGGAKHLHNDCKANATCRLSNRPTVQNHTLTIYKLSNKQTPQTQQPHLQERSHVAVLFSRSEMCEKSCSGPEREGGRGGGFMDWRRHELLCSSPTAADRARAARGVSLPGG